MPVIRDQAASIQQHRYLPINCDLKIDSCPVETNQPGGFGDQVFSFNPGGRLNYFEDCQAIFVRSNSVSTSKR